MFIWKYWIGFWQQVSDIVEEKHKQQEKHTETWFESICVALGMLIIYIVFPICLIYYFNKN